MIKLKNFVITIFIFISLVMFGFYLVELLKSKQIIEKKSEALSLITSESFIIKNQLDRALSSTYALGLVIKENNGYIDDFQRIAKTLKEIFNEIDILIISPNFIISDVYPPEERNFRIGTNILDNAERKKDILDAVNSKKLLLTGPYNLINGGTGIIGYYPVYIKKNNISNLWGMISVTINVEHLIESTNIKYLEKRDYDFELCKIESDTKKKTIIASTPKTNIIDTVTFEIDIQNTENNWFLSVKPKKGWFTNEMFFLLYILVLIISTIISIAVFFLISQPDILNEKIKIASKELLEKEKLLNQAEKMASLGKLTSAMAHEIRQPLNSIKILTDGVIFWHEENQKADYEEMIENFKNISKFVDKIEDTIKNLKLMINSPERIELTYCNINKIIKDVTKLFNQKLLTHSIILKEEYYENISEFLLSEHQFQQVIVNLLDNAIHSLDNINSDNKKIIIKTLENEKELIVQMFDNGTGVSDENKEKIFEPFFSTKQDKDSMGMGLSVIKNILKTIHSDIIVKDNEEGGAVFEVKLIKDKGN